jgi:PAS domain S-box-containing protein
MSESSENCREHRLLTLLPTGKDAALTASILAKAGLESYGCATLDLLLEELKRGAGAILIAEEAIAEDSAHRLAATLEQQPPWSDIHVLVVTRQGADSSTADLAVSMLGNVTLLERPIRIAALISAARTALRARRRQYQFRQQFETLERSERNLTDFFENAAVGLHLVSSDGIILRVNQTELDLLGYTSEEYVGHHIAEFHADAEAITDVLRRLHVGENIESYEARLRAKDGSIRHVLISSNVLWEDGQFIHARCFTRDITQRKHAEDALREADKRKDEFLATLAHELRNPLAPIRNSLHILRMTGNGDPTTERVCEMLERQVSHMVRLVDDLMEVSRITRGKIELHKELLEVAAVVRSAVETSRPLIEAAGHQLAISVPTEPLVVEGDLVRLAQVLANLLNNAAKYTETGGQIWLSVRRDECCVAISVKDTGIGISAEMLPRVFDLFAQEETSFSRAQGGLGIGLSLVRSLAEMHGGEVVAHSAGVGQGSEFIVRLPLAMDIPHATQTSSNGLSAPLLAARRVLVVDDNRDAANSLGMLLKLLGVDVRVVGNGRAALELIPCYRPSVVLLDIGMPEMDGYEVARKIRALPEFEGLTLIALTGWGQENDRERSRLAGFDHHLIKPADITTLRALLDSAESKVVPAAIE